jgi:hypothetical protein
MKWDTGILRFWRLRWAGYVDCMGRQETHTNFDGENNLEAATRRTEMRWVNNIEMDIREIIYEVCRWTELVQVRV